MIISGLVGIYLVHADVSKTSHRIVTISHYDPIIQARRSVSIDQVPEVAKPMIFDWLDRTHKDYVAHSEYMDNV